MAKINQIYQVLEGLVEGALEGDKDRVLQLNGELNEMMMDHVPLTPLENKYDNFRQSCLISVTMPKIREMMLADAQERFSKLPEPKQIYASKFLQGLTRPLAQLITGYWFDIRLEGKENIPEKGPAIFAFNHVSIPDSFIIAGKIDIIDYFISKVEPFVPVVKTLAVKEGTYPVDTKGKARHRELAHNYALLFPERRHEEILRQINQYLPEGQELKDFLNVDNRLFTEYALNAGASTLIHIPGHRQTYDEIKNPKKGAAWNALNMYDKYGLIVPIIPGSIVYSRHGQPFIVRDLKWPYRTRADIRAGKPLFVEEFFERNNKRKKDDQKKVVNELTDIIAAEVDLQTNLILANLQDHRKN